MTDLVSHPPPPPANYIHLRLQLLVDSRPEQWTYVIFWRACPDTHCLSFGDGHFRGTRDDSAAACDDAEWFYAVSLTRSFAADEATVTARVYAMQGLAWLMGAHALHSCGCYCTNEAQLHGIETLVCVAVAGIESSSLRPPTSSTRIEPG